MHPATIATSPAWPFAPLTSSMFLMWVWAHTHSQQLDLAGAINTFRLGETTLQRAPTSANAEHLFGLTTDELGNQSIKRTWSLSPIGDVKIEPSLKVPLFNHKGNQVQFDISSIPSGKIGIGTAAGITGCMKAASCVDYIQDYLNKSLK
jgi:hypothetical protein